MSVSSFLPCLGIEPLHTEVKPYVVSMTRWFQNRNLANAMPDAVCQINHWVKENNLDATGPYQVLNYTKSDLSVKTKCDPSSRLATELTLQAGLSIILDCLQELEAGCYQHGKRVPVIQA
jgi:hypothetical protein